MTADELRLLQRKEYEKDRRKALRQRRKAWGRDRVVLESQFGPGTHGCHEAFHVSNMIVELIERELVEHSAVLLDQEWYALIREAQDSLYQAYKHAGRLHNGPDEAPAQDAHPPHPMDIRNARKITKTIQ